jgi:hypothetical protein
MDNTLVTVCKNCGAWINYDADGEKPELCIDCEEEAGLANS